jgi:outer membrane murein-binding lipoprotein Lpp
MEGILMQGGNSGSSSEEGLQHLTARVKELEVQVEELAAEAANAQVEANRATAAKVAAERALSVR